MRSEKRRRPTYYLFGILMGSADVVPGVSGGTVALILGIYEKLVGSIGAAAVGAASLARGRIDSTREWLGQVDWGFLILLGAGVATAVLLGARVIEPLLESYPVQLRALFFGLIAGSLRAPWRQIDGPDTRSYLLAALAAVAAFGLSGIPPRDVVDPPLIVVFFTAMIAICALILPGVSGAYLLIVMGMYQPTLEALNQRNMPYVAVFILGALIGLGGFSRILQRLLAKHQRPTMAILVGLMVGSLRALWPYQDEARGLIGPPSAGSLLAMTGIAAVGFLIVFVITQVGTRMEPGPE